MWVIAVDAAALLVGLALLGLLGWRVVVRPGLALSRAFADVAGRASGAVTAISVSQTPTARRDVADVTDA